MSANLLKKGIVVPAGKDRNQENDLRIWGMIPLATKVSTRDTDGKLFAFVHTDMGNGGPPRHVHHNQDEWFFVIKGEFVIEVGGDRFHLNAGDSAFAPRQIPHAWANVGDEPGTLLTTVTPAGTFETFIRDTANYTELPTPEAVAQAFSDHDMTIVGPPLAIK